MIINASPAFRRAMRVWRVQDDAGYIIDAPLVMPAGGCRQAYVEDFKCYLAEQLECEREENYGY
jgi:hypothetical protein